MKMKGRLLGLAICIAGALAFAPAVSQANISKVWDLTSDHCSGTGGCLNGASGGTVTVTDDGMGTLQFAIDLLNGYKLINTGFPTTFAFNLFGINQILYSGLPTNWLIPDEIAGGFQDKKIGGYHQDGTGYFDYGVLFCIPKSNDPTKCEQGNAGADGSSLTFTISATGLDWTDLVQNADGQFFAIDIIGFNGNTGNIDASNPPIERDVPEPQSLALLGLGLVGLAVVRRRRNA
jgi:hypothetical protein